MPELTRRRFLGTAGAAATAAFAAEFLPANLRKALAAGPQRGSGRLSDIKHVVILMQENRSFDHYFGTLPGVAGFADPNALTLSTGKSVFYQPDPQNPDGYLLPWRLNTLATSAQAIPSSSHAWHYQHTMWDNGAMDNFVPSQLAAKGVNGPYTMGYYTREDIPFQFALAENFTICDHYFCSVLGPTWPNRLMHICASIDPQGVGGGPITANIDPVPYEWQSYPEALTDAGVSWQVYQEVDNYETNLLEMFRSFQNAPVSSTLYQSGMRTFQPGQFEWDAMHDRLPTVSWLIPTSYQSEHPDYTPAAGADFVASKIDAIAANPDVWAKTVFILNYDENDGLFDHVLPPTPPPGTPNEFIAIGGDPSWPIGGGFRVPCIIVSPWTQGGWIASQNFDHTSVLQFLEVLTGVTIPNITPWRRSTFGDLTSAFGFPQFPSAVPHLPGTKEQLAQAAINVNTLPEPAFPGASQTPPVQETGPRPRPRNTTREI
ncbi:MAG TPA: alkaline phosphatase family protein [Streptosporangiaceae bacterium]|nr:alkaline phosphatase family protein [Streptosporangiaceae bacterium]